MTNQLSWKVGGQQGEGIESTGEIFALVLNRLGYYLYGYRHFSSRIKGGHTNNKIRVSTTEVRAISDDLDILVAFDQETVDFNYKELHEGGIIIADSNFEFVNPADNKAQVFQIPFTATSKAIGDDRMKNMVAIGATCAVLGLESKTFADVISEYFASKGPEVVEKNKKAIESGFEQQTELLGGKKPFQLAKADGKKRLFMIGNDAIALGALAGGCRFMAAYPITPASEIMDYLMKKLPALGGTVIQTEDEIAAATMTIGANYGGVRAITASAGPGLSLKMEAIGLAGMTETPIVIIDTQRGGPSTGLATKHEQSDLMQMIYGTHGEIPKIVIAPSTAEEAFYDTAEALNLAEEYQCPVIVLSDLQLSLGKQTVNQLDVNSVEIRRGKIVTEDLPEREDKSYFKRYEFTHDGISPRVIPGTKNGIYHVTGVEHDEVGRPVEGSVNRQKQMDKRFRKMKNIQFAKKIHHYTPHENPDVLLVGFISTRGAIEEAMVRLEKDGIKANHLHIRLIHPFPTEEILPLVQKAKKVVVVENNATGQLANILKMNLGYPEKIVSLLKYDGNPFLPNEVHTKTKELL